MAKKLTAIFLLTGVFLGSFVAPASAATTTDKAFLNELERVQLNEVGNLSGDEVDSLLSIIDTHQQSSTLARIFHNILASHALGGNYNDIRSYLTKGIGNRSKADIAEALNLAIRTNEDLLTTNDLVKEITAILNSDDSQKKLKNDEAGEILALIQAGRQANLEVIVLFNEWIQYEITEEFLEFQKEASKGIFGKIEGPIWNLWTGSEKYRSPEEYLRNSTRLEISETLRRAAAAYSGHGGSPLEASYGLLGGSGGTLFSNTSCSSSKQDISDFIVNGIVGGGALAVFDKLTSTANDLPYVGGLFEPIDQMADKLKSWWFTAAMWGLIATLANTFIGNLVEAALQLNMGLSSETPFVSFGYGIVLGVVNIGLVIAVIVTAFVVMFRSAKVPFKKTLTRLIIAALLINFTMLFAITIFNLGNNLTAQMVKITNPCPGSFGQWFSVAKLHSYVDDAVKSSIFGEGEEIDPDRAEELIKELEPENQSLWNKFTKAIGGNSVIQSVKEFTDTNGRGVVGIVQKIIIAIVATFFASIFSFIGTLTFAALFLFLVIRYIAVSILLIIAPLMWLGFIFDKLKMPGLGNPFKGWWENFLKWVFYGPIVVFFLAVATEFLKFIGTDKHLPDNFIAGAFTALTELMIAAGLMSIGLWATNKMSMVGAGLVTKGLVGGLRGLSGGMQKFWQKRALNAEIKGNKRRQKFYENMAKSAALQEPISTILKGTGLIKKDEKEEKIDKNKERRKLILSEAERNPKTTLSFSQNDLKEIEKDDGDFKKFKEAHTKIDPNTLSAEQLTTYQQQKDFIDRSEASKRRAKIIADAVNNPSAIKDLIENDVKELIKSPSQKQVLLDAYFKLSKEDQKENAVVDVLSKDIERRKREIEREQKERSEKIDKRTGMMMKDLQRVQNILSRLNEEPKAVLDLLEDDLDKISQVAEFKKQVNDAWVKLVAKPILFDNEKQIEAYKKLEKRRTTLIMQGKWRKQE